jgi:hypothetical protein
MRAFIGVVPETILIPEQFSIGYIVSIHGNNYLNCIKKAHFAVDFLCF